MSATTSGLQEKPEAAKKRVLELYKYFIPPSPTSPQSKPSSGDSVLAAHAQLVAHRLNCRRAMVSLIGRTTQHFIAESSKTLDLTDSSRYDDPLDSVWAGCVSVPKAGRLCEHTIAAVPPVGGEHAYFEVLDLQQDPRFNQLPFVTGPPSYRYYCGVPLKTKNGVNIGSIFALDEVVREPLSPSLISFMATMSRNCMDHLEALKERERMKRYKVMNFCLTAFVDPENRSRRKRRSRKSSLTPSTASSISPPLVATTKTAEPAAPKSSPQPSKAASPMEVTDADSQDNSDGSAPTKVKKVEDDDYLHKFKSAAALLSQSLDIKAPSGVLFLDTGTALNDTAQLSAEESSSDDDRPKKPKPSHASAAGATQVSYKSWSGSLAQPEAFDAASPIANPSEVLSSSSELCLSPDGSLGSGTFDFRPPPQNELSKLIKRYPRGVILNLEDQDVIPSISSSEDGENAYILPRTQSTSATKAESVQLRSSFPNARQVIFVPVWNPSFSRFSAFFAVNRNPYRNFQSSPDFLHSIAFCHCLTTELTRIVTVAADQQKSDFIGSISHELRSPLHGILASCEFLGDTELSSFQKSLTDTADSCARTLLDTINMVLDYSKINAFERNITRARRDKKHQRHVIPTSQLQPALNIYGEVDLAAIAEEVVEGVATGQVFKDRLAYVDATDFGQPPAAHSQSKGSLPDVEVILDLPPRNWTFLTQPGAFRRVVMNVFGNSLKYTSKGHISVKLEAQPAPKRTEESDEVHIITLTITDTGQGISPRYMKTRLFTPFAQESTISPGTGLGLSLVHSIIRMLNGEIDIKSTVGVGTEVIMKFPMDTSPPGSDKQSQTDSKHSESTPSTGGIERTKDDSLHLVRGRVKGRSALYYTAPQSGSGSGSDSSALLKDVVCGYLTKWYYFSLQISLDADNLPDVIVVRETDFPILLKAVPGVLTKNHGPMIVVICSSAASSFDSSNLEMNRVETISYPFGPYKLAKIIRICLDNLDRAAVAETDADDAASRHSTEKDEVTEVVQSVDELTIGRDLKVVQQGQMMANEEFAPLMVEALSAQSTRSIEQGPGFPFPSVVESAETPRATLPPQAPAKRVSMRPKPEMSGLATPGPATTIPSSSPKRTPKNPRLLLVDDNRVNLRLLNTFMQKRGYTDVHMAEDGAASVERYRSMILADLPQPPDIIFMDISMPIMNGFEATRKIRDLETAFRDPLPPMQTPPPCMIIALTGLASSRDQSEAFTSGFDLYLVKPISFKSVAKLLDSWERNGGAATLNIPHGPLSGENIQPA